MNIPGSEFAITAHLNAGGRGSRLAGNSLVEDSFNPELGVAKALLEVGLPAIRLIDHQLNFLRKSGLSHVVVDSGDQTSVKDYVEQRYSSDVVTAVGHAEQLGTAGDMIRTTRAFSRRIGKTVLALNVDTILDINLAELARIHAGNGTAATIALTLRNNVPHEGAYYVGAGDRVVFSNESSTSKMTPPVSGIKYRGSSTGAVALDRDYITGMEWDDTKPFSLYSDVLGLAVEQHSLAAYNNGQRFFMDVGTPETLKVARANDSPVQPYLQY